METNKKYEQDIDEYYRRIVEPIFSKVPQETPKNLLLVGKSLSLKDKYSLYNPHNYRLYIDFQKINFHLKPNPTQPKVRGLGLVVKNHKELWTTLPILGCRIRVKKTCVQVDNLIDHKKWYVIQLGEISKRKDQIRKIIINKDNQCIESLKAFIELFGGKSEFRILNRYCHNKCMREKHIDNLPLKMQFDTPIVKKLYMENSIEYVDPLSAGNFFSNLGIKDIAPGIESAINGLADKLESIKKPPKKEVPSKSKRLIRGFDMQFVKEVLG